MTLELSMDSTMTPNSPGNVEFLPLNGGFGQEMEQAMESIESEIMHRTNTVNIEGRRLPLLRVIRLKCLDCCCGQINEVRLCTVTSCVLWPFRMAKDPYRKRSPGHTGQFQKKGAPHVAS